MRILLVDDDPEIRLLAGHLLRGAGHEVIDAADAESARRTVAAGCPDVLLMDVKLGAADGVALGAELVTGCGALTRLVFLTGATRQDQLQRMTETAAAGVVHKPFDPGAFVTAVETMAARS
jgi:CheY-like chemotaxis protein